MSIPYLHHKAICYIKLVEDEDISLTSRGENFVECYLTPRSPEILFTLFIYNLISRILFTGYVTLDWYLIPRKQTCMLQFRDECKSGI